MRDLDLGKLLSTSKLLLDKLRVVQHGTKQHADADVFFHVLDYVIGEYEVCISAAGRTSAVRLAAATRNLFELTFITEYICQSAPNMARFRADKYIDELEMMAKLEQIDKRDPATPSSPTVEERKRNSIAEVPALGFSGQKPLMPRNYADAIGKVTHFEELYKFYSKMTHATAWIILGGCRWEPMITFLVSRATVYVRDIGQAVEKSTVISSNAAQSSG